MPGYNPGITVSPLQTSARTLILGVDPAGWIVQHDRTSEVVAVANGSLLGAHLSDVVALPALAQPPLAAVLDAVAGGREATAALAISVGGAAPVEAVVSVQPMRGSDPALAALVIFRLPPGADERFPGPAVLRDALLEDAFGQIGITLDLDQMACKLVNIVVPHFCNSASLLVFESLVSACEPHREGGDSPLRRLATASDVPDSAWEAAFPVGEVFCYPPETPQRECLDERKPVRIVTISAGKAAEVARSWSRGPMGGILAGSSMLLLPVMAADSALGLITCVRRAGFREFDACDAGLGMEFASRAAIYIDNARRYSRERTTSLTLQRSLLPTGLSTPSSVQIGHRYLPGSQLIEVGGDWYDAIALPGARAALVVGDVVGHGVHAAAAMGRLRTAIQTLARLELPPADSLQHLDELMEDMGVLEPHFATCVYAVYDAVSGTCEVASAGHLPPLLVAPDGTSAFLDVDPAPPLGIGDGLTRSSTFDIEDGSLLVLYTDGLVERQGTDIDEGLARLQAVFGPGSATRPVDELCAAVLASAYDQPQHDDIAVLIARLNRLDPRQHASFDLPAELTAVSRARSLTAAPLDRWDLTSLLPATQLLVSELVTNAIRYTQGPVTLRLIHEGSLVCEVHDTSPALPRLRHADTDDECGRGLEIVSQISHRWGARRTANGKVVWCEQQRPNT